MLSSIILTLALVLSAFAAPSGLRRANRRAINNTPAEIAVTAPDGVIRPFRRAINTLPAEIAVTAPNGVARPYRRAA
jgi:hypothetical protein